ncbi:MULTISPECIES: diguanylate cyclase [unclassified Roseofilum]|uniref:GGDEF domain-containing protein n=1 Tax=unclassified Roseofilum TaxID=2620099 RepID=UPI001AFEF1C0|nr:MULTISPECIES: diguanylate cyclase [unclassified Roseofilum]MBP0007032.1 GGDEF domain-containing protein [Roseofilum sp. Belize Diploria]MBP0013324.1 GGDEF domain-containing protein [Roseofilum sp. SID3]MBP0023987.1 GGDEF domain-containing protein [Roseofilum sp. SID2]MBP0031540.1 GGDEF domain-containing protein [Roseofilum sp. Belize BBD 4]MBP0039161.1 GGDEF domain-containing protein [Roseofilum sp. SID1]
MNQGSKPKQSSQDDSASLEDIKKTGEKDARIEPEWRKFLILARLQTTIWITLGGVFAIALFEAILYGEQFASELLSARITTLFALVGCWGLQKTQFGRRHPSLLFLGLSWSVTLLPQVLGTAAGVCEFQPELWLVMFLMQATAIPVSWPIHIIAQGVVIAYFCVNHWIFGFPPSELSHTITVESFLFLAMTLLVCYFIIYQYEQLSYVEWTTRQELEAVNKQVKNLTLFDRLTQLPNRRRFNEFIEQEWRRMKRDLKPLSLIVCRVDYFKPYVYSYGSQTSNECLKSIADAIRSVVKRPADMVARYRGEMFAILLPQTNVEGAMQVATYIHSEISSLKLVHPNSPISPYITVSLGVSSVVPRNDDSEVTLIVTAGEALAEAQALGGDNIIVKTPQGLRLENSTDLDNYTSGPFDPNSTEN